jgi:hypothetical protein
MCLNNLSPKELTQYNQLKIMGWSNRKILEEIKKEDFD